MEYKVIRLTSTIWSAADTQAKIDHWVKLGYEIVSHTSVFDPNTQSLIVDTIIFKKAKP